jgi:hypothetical protein
MTEVDRLAGLGLQVDQLTAAKTRAEDQVATLQAERIADEARWSEER